MMWVPECTKERRGRNHSYKRCGIIRTFGNKGNLVTQRKNVPVPNSSQRYKPIKVLL